MKRSLISAMLCLLWLTACEREPPPPKTPPPPPPPSAEELHGKVMGAIRPFMNSDPNSQVALPATLASEVGKLKTQVNGDKARAKVEGDVKDALKAAYDAEQWQAVLTLCDATEVLDKGNTRVVRYRERAIAEKNKPIVTVRGVFEVDGVSTVFMDVYLPETNEQKDVKVREGEEFFGLILEKILGNDAGVQLKYLKTDQSFTVKGVSQ